MQRIPGDAAIYISADPVRGYIVLWVAGLAQPPVRMSAVQCEQLEQWLARARQVVETGIGGV